MINGISLLITLFILAFMVKMVWRFFVFIFSPLISRYGRFARGGRYANTHFSGLTLLLSRFFDLCELAIIWCRRTFADLLGLYLVFWVFLPGLFELFNNSTEWNGTGLFFLETGLIALLVLIAAFPTFFLANITEPLGLVRGSWLLAKLARFSYRRDFKGGYLFSAVSAWEQTTDINKSARQRDWLQKKLVLCHDNGAPSLLCYILLNWRQIGDKRAGMLKAVYFVDSFHCPRRIQARAGAKYAAIMAGQGDWQEVYTWSWLWLKKAPSLELFFYYLVGRRMTGLFVPGGSLTLGGLWLVCLNHKINNPILAKALDGNGGKVESMLDFLNSEEQKTERTTGLQALLSFDETALLRQDREAIHGLGRYFEAILAEEEDAVEIEAILSRILGSWNDLATGTVPDGAKSLLVVGTEEGDDSQLESLHYNLQSLLRRYEADEQLDIALEWREFGGIMALYEQNSSNPATHYQAYQEAGNVCLNWAVWLWNTRQQKVLATAVFCWVRQEALFFEDYDIVELLDKNLSHF